MFLRTVEAGRRLANVATNPETGEVVVVPAAPEESAVITYHRMEQAEAEKIILATRQDSKTGIAILLRVSRDETTPGTPKTETYDLTGDLTTLEWIQLAQRDEAQGKARHFTANGNEFEVDFDLIGKQSYEMA